MAGVRNNSIPVAVRDVFERGRKGQSFTRICGVGYSGLSIPDSTALVHSHLTVNAHFLFKPKQMHKNSYLDGILVLLSWNVIYTV